ncbi:MAG: hypothetical protein AB7E96_07895 [Deferribacterales bacterium]
MKFITLEDNFQKKSKFVLAVRLVTAALIIFILKISGIPYGDIGDKAVAVAAGVILYPFLFIACGYALWFLANLALFLKNAASARRR